MSILASIAIGMNPNILDFGPFLLSWHGIMTFVAVAVAVYLVHRWGTRDGLDSDALLSVVVWCIIGGIIGARLMHVIDFWGLVYSHDKISVLYVWQGGIAIYGAILGGFAGGVIYIKVRNSQQCLTLWGRYFRFLGEPNAAPLGGIGHLADLAAPALLIAMAIGRIGDVINGEHFASFTSLPWGVIYTHAASPAINIAASHPAVAYELLFDLALAVVVWSLRNRLRPRGMLFVLYGGLYSTGRFFLSFLREERVEYFLGFNEAQIVALLVVIVAIPILVYKAQWINPGSGEESRSTR